MSDLIERLSDKTRLRAAHGLTGWVLAEEALLAEAANEIKRLRAALAEAEQDARRYRWLRGGPDVPSWSERWPRWEVRNWNGRHWNTLFADQMDAAIDAARGKE